MLVNSVPLSETIVLGRPRSTIAAESSRTTRASYKIQREFPELRKLYWGQRFWARGYFSTTSGNVTDDVILQYLELLII